MVCSQVYSQHLSHCVFSNVHQHRPLVPSNAEVCCREPESSEANWLGNTTSDGQFLSSKGYASSGYANTTSPFKSSWIQRLIPSSNMSVEHPQPLDKFNKENHGIDGLPTHWKENAGRLTILGNQSDFPVYENSRRSKQVFFGGHQTYLSTNAPGCVRSGTNISLVVDDLPPEVQVSPKSLPVVESLLPGHSKKVTENQTSTEKNMPHILSRCTGLTYPIKQTVNYSADEKSRVSCSSIEGLNSNRVVCAAGDLLALKASKMVKRCVGPSQPLSEFSFNRTDAVTRSNMGLTSGGKDKQTGTNLRTHMSSTQTEDPFITLHTESRCHDLHAGQASSVARCQSVEYRLLDGYSVPYREEATELFQAGFSQANPSTSNVDERLPLGLSMDQLMCMKTISRRNHWNPKDHHSYAHGDSAAFCTREGSCDGGWWSIPSTEKGGPRQSSNFVPLHFGPSVAKEKAGIPPSHHRIEQDLGSPHGSHEEQGGTSRSFSFHFENRLASELDHSKEVMRKGQWPFGPLSSEDLVQSRRSEDNRGRGLSEATRPGLPFDNSSIFQEIGVHEAGSAYIGRSQSSPFFGTENLNASAGRRISDNHDEAACIDIRGVFTGDMNTKALPGGSVDQARQALQGGHTLSRLESNLMIKGEEGTELTFSFPSRTVSVKNWKACKSSIQSSTRTCSPEGAQLNHSDCNCVSVNNWKAFKPSSRSSTHTCPPEGAQVNHADGTLGNSSGSVGSCSERLSNLCIEDPPTRSRPITQEMALPSGALRKQSHSSQMQCGGTGVNSAPVDQESEGKGALGWGTSGSAVKQNIWLQRWSTMSSRKAQAVSMLNREGSVLAGMTRARNYVYSTSQGSRESSHRFDLRPTKRVCYENRSDLPHQLGNAISKIGSVAVGMEHNGKGVASHFMKRYFTPSAAAMAIMGMTARKVHATQPQRSGLFGVWASNVAVRKSSEAKAEVCKEVLTKP